LARAVEELCRQGLVDERGAEQRVRRLDRATRAEFARNAQRRGYKLPDAVSALLIDGFVRLHGITVMEVFGQLAQLTDRPEDYAACLVDGLIADLLGDTRQTVATTSSSTTRSRNASTEASR
jgi:hypothetical protein